MEDSQSASDPALVGAQRPGGNGRAASIPRSLNGNAGAASPLRSPNRSELLRRGCRFPFNLRAPRNGIRIRRERRVSDSFSGIPSLARTPDQDGSASESRD